jgi:hypothetical protein
VSDKCVNRKWLAQLKCADRIEAVQLKMRQSY